MISFCTHRAKRRLVRALDALTVGWATNNLPMSCRWLLNTQVLFLQKDQDEVQKDFDDDEWLQDVPEYLVADEGR